MNYCFLDTNIFYGSKKKIQNFFSANFKRLISYTEYGIIQLIMPEVTLQELYAHFDENIDALYELVGQAGLPIEIIDTLKNTRDKNLIRTQLTDAFQQFLRDTKCVTLPMNSLTVNASEFVRRRYAYEAPFTPEKEDEYQDLFAVQALRDFITAKAHEKDRLIVITKDGGFRRYCQSVLPEEKTLILDNLSKYRPFDLSPETERIRLLAQDAFESYLRILQDHLRDVLDYTDLDLPYCQNDYELQDQDVELTNPVVESVDVFDSEIYAYVKCDCEYEAYGEGFSEEQSEYDAFAHRYTKIVREKFRVQKKTEVRFIVNLFAETDDQGMICDIENINDIDIVSELPFRLSREDVTTAVTGVQNVEWDTP